MKNRTDLLLINFFFGWMGGHRFYLREYGIACLYLLFSPTGIPFFIAIIDFFVFFTMDKYRFNRLYNQNNFNLKESDTLDNHYSSVNLSERKGLISNSKVDNRERFRKRDQIKYTYHGLRCFAHGLNSAESIVKNYLSEELDTKRYYIFNNLTLETKEGSTQIDHVVLSPYGIFVIETKDYKGWIFGSRNGKVWTQSLLGDNKFTFQNPFRQNYKHKKTLEDYLPFIQSFSFKDIIAFGSGAEFKTSMPEQVMYLDKIASYIKSFRHQEISKSAYFMAIGKLSQLCQSTDIDSEKHIENLGREHVKVINY